MKQRCFEILLAIYWSIGQCQYLNKIGRYILLFQNFTSHQFSWKVTRPGNLFSMVQLEADQLRTSPCVPHPPVIPSLLENNSTWLQQKRHRDTVLLKVDSEGHKCRQKVVGNIFCEKLIDIRDKSSNNIYEMPSRIENL